MSALHAAIARQIEIDLAAFPSRWVPLPPEAEAPGLLAGIAEALAAVMAAATSAMVTAAVDAADVVTAALSALAGLV